MTTPQTNPTACTQPGCAGSIVDGYCDVCGSPGDAAPAPDSPTRVRTVAPAAGSSQACSQPGCTGTIVDGYCDVCGAPPPAGTGELGTESPAEDQAVSGLSRSTGSSALHSAPLGSARSTGGSKITRRVGSGSQRLRAARLGAGLTRVPPAPAVDASAAVMTNPEVPENKRNCPKCGSPVGRSRDGQPGRTEGFCPKCGTRFSFTPKLRPGELVANQYEVAGCLAHGGLGWIYLARDRNVSNRWVVLKGLLNTGDADALAVAIAEQQFLAQVEHPLIVEIYNFVTHSSSGGDSGDGEAAGYIVMEYVGGTSLKQILKNRMRANGGVYDPLPVDQALAYILEVLPAFTYLHDLGLVYCDFKPDNLIQIGDAVKLIDLGAVRRIDDESLDSYGTVGYSAPELSTVNPSVASDIYTIGRTLVVLMTEFRGYQTRFVASLPPVADTPLFQQYDSLYRLLAKACAPDPADRFVSVDELRVQLLGVLREVVAARTTGTALTSAASVLFEAPAISSDALAWNELPALRPDTSDPQWSWLSNVSVEDPAERLSALAQAPAHTAEVRLAEGRAALQLGDGKLIEQIVNQMLTDDPWEWRAVWLSGLSALQHDDPAAAEAAFNAVYGQVPGELAPKLALALACERGGQLDVAERLYATCAGTDANYVAPAAFGMSRVRFARHEVPAAVEALNLVPVTSRSYTESRRRQARLLYSEADTLPVLAQAMRTIDGVRLSTAERAQIAAAVLERGLALVHTKGPDATVVIDGRPAEEGPLRDGLEATFRTLAGVADSDAERYALVDRANAVRRWTLT